MAELEHKKWSGKTGGTYWMQQSLIVLVRVVGLRVMYAVMALVIPFYMIFNRKGYTSMKLYFERHRGDKGLRTVWHIYRNHFVFGQIILDRFAVYAGKRFSFTEDGQHIFDDLAKQPEGMVLLSSHVGNYEMAGYTLNSDQKGFNALVFGGETETVMQNRGKLLTPHQIRMIPVSEDLSHIFQLNAALENGEIVSIPADRVFGSAKTITCDFMGSKASFPMGSFALAAQKEVPVLAVFVMKEKVYGYKVIVRRLNVDSEKNIKGRMNDLAQQFAHTLQEVVEQYPYQWFNYYDFWQET